MSAIPLSPSQHQLGNSGNWSTYAINVGNPAQTLFVLPSTSGRSTWVVLPQGCEANGDPSDCDTSRGGVFDPTKSSSFRQDVNDGPNTTFYALNFGPEAPLNAALPQNQTYSGNALPGTDVLSFVSDSNGPKLEQQLIAGYATKVPFLGQLGLSAVNESVVNFQDTYFSVLGALRNVSAIPSLYWGYTEGAQYNQTPTAGSLVLGGYDATRGNVQNVLTAQMNQTDTDRALTLAIASITLTNLSEVSRSQNTLATTGSLPAFIDSVVPEIWLPTAVCTIFEQQWGLVWNDTADLYLVDDALHTTLTNSGASVTFKLAANVSSTETVDITLPYAAFDKVAEYPLLKALYPNDSTTTSRYFPLKRAGNTDQIYLGRTFLQEAYIAADYDNQQFNISPATYTSADQNIVTVHYSPKGAKSNSGLSGGAIAGIVIGAVAGVALIAGLLWWFCWRKRKPGKKSKRRDTVGTSSVGDDTTIAEWNNEVQLPQMEHYKGPAEVSGDDLERMKQELDANETARGNPNERHELWGGTVRRQSDQSRASISPLDERHRMSRFSHQRTISGQSYGQPSPQMSGEHPTPPLGTSGRDSPFGQQPSPQPEHGHPALPEDGRSWFGGAPVYHELHGRSRGSPRSPTSPVQTPEEVPLSGEDVLGTPASERSPERETRRSGFVEQFGEQRNQES